MKHVHFKSAILFVWMMSSLSSSSSSFKKMQSGEFKTVVIKNIV